MTKKKFAGAHIPASQRKALKKLAKSKGYRSVADMIRAIYDAALAESSPPVSP
jgi:hypothetical protein